MENEVALWQRGVHHDEAQHEAGTAALLFGITTKTVSQILRILAEKPDLKVYNGVRDEFRKFYMWNEGFSTLSGGLDRRLDGSKGLKATVLELMASWVKSVLKVPTVLPDYDWSSALPSLDQLGEVALKVGQSSKAAQTDMDSLYSKSNPLNLDEDSDSESDFDSECIDEGLEFILEDVGFFMESLVDLTPSLEYPAADFTTNETPIIDPIAKVSNIPEEARPYAVIINDRFPLMNNFSLVKKLAEANAKRNEQLRAAILRHEDNTSLDEDGEQPVLDHSTISGFTKPSTIESDLFSTPAVQKAESVTSFASSMGDWHDSGRRRIPNPAGGHIFGTPFRCQFCGEIQRDIYSRADWKKHVYKHLEPYICTFVECSLGPHTFHSRKEWIDHEFQTHRVKTSWECSLCTKSFQTDDLFRDHITNICLHDLDSCGPSRIEDFVRYSKRLASRPANTEECPFCFNITAVTQKGFARHVCRHQHEISLAALPHTGTDEENSDDGSIDSDKIEIIGQKESLKAPVDSGGSEEREETAPKRELSDEEVNDDETSQDWDDISSLSSPNLTQYEQNPLSEELNASNERIREKDETIDNLTNSFANSFSQPASTSTGMVVNAPYTGGQYSTPYQTTYGQQGGNTQYTSGQSTTYGSSLTGSSHPYSSTYTGGNSMTNSSSYYPSSTGGSGSSAPYYTIHNSSTPIAGSSNSYYPSNTENPQGYQEGGSGDVTPQNQNVHLSANPENTYQDCDPNFRIHPSSDFKAGVVFKVWWTEPRGENSYSYQRVGTAYHHETVNKDRFYTKMRRFIVIGVGRGYSQCVPILTYQHQATTKAGVKFADHAVVYIKGAPPVPIKGEQPLPNNPIEISVMNPREKLDPASRIHYAKTYTVEHNVKVNIIGKVSTNFRKIFSADFDRIQATINRTFG